MRKKNILLFIVLILAVSHSAFPLGKAGKGGGFTAEFNGDLFNDDKQFLTPSFFKLRFLVNEKLAFRLTTWVDFSSDQKVPESTLNYFYLAARPGIEFHIASSPGSYASYIGIEAIFDFANHNFETKLGTPVTGAWSIDDIKNFENRGYQSLGAVLVGGADIYKGGNFYFGTEIGLAYTRTKHAEVKYGSDLFLGECQTSTFKIDLSRVVRIGFLIN